MFECVRVRVCMSVRPCMCAWTCVNGCICVWVAVCLDGGGARCVRACVVACVCVCIQLCQKRLVDAVECWSSSHDTPITTLHSILSHIRTKNRLIDKKTDRGIREKINR